MLSWLAHHALDLFSWGIPLLGWGFNRRHFISHRSRPRRSIFSGVHVTAHARVGRRVSRPSRRVYRTPRRQPSVRHGYHPGPSERTSFALRRTAPSRGPVRGTSVFGGLSAPTFGRVQGQAAARTARAASALPQQTRLPAIPLLRSYSRPQQLAVSRLVARAAGGSGTHYKALTTDPGSQDKLRIKAIERAGAQTYQHGQAQNYRRRVAAVAAGTTPGAITAGPSALTPQQKARLRRAAPVLQELARGHTVPFSWQARREAAYQAAQPQAHQTIKGINPKHPPKPGGGTSVLGIPVSPGLVQFATQKTLFGPLAKGIGRFPGVRDALNLPANVVTGGYYGGAAAVEALQGHPQRAQQLARSFKNTDPIALAVQGRWKEAVHAAAQHPLYTGLEVSGIGSALGKTAGVGGEAAAFSRAAVGAREGRMAAGLRAAAGVRHRAPQTLEGTNVVLPRRYSRNLATRGAQKAADRRRAVVSQRLLTRAEQRQAQGRYGAARDLRAKGIQKSGLQVSERHQRRALDELVAANEDIRRLHRAQVMNAVGKVLPKRGKRAMSTVVQGITRPSRASIERYIADLEHQAAHGDLQPPQLLANETLRHELGKAVTSRAARKTDWAKVQTAAAEYAKITRPLEAHLIERGVFDAHQVAKARAIPYAVREMGARHDPVGEARQLAHEQDLTHQLGILEMDRQQLLQRLAAHDQGQAAARAQTEILPHAAAIDHPHAGNELATHYQQLHEIRQAIADAGPNHPDLGALRRERRRIEARVAASKQRAGRIEGQTRTAVTKAQVELNQARFNARTAHHPVLKAEADARLRRAEDALARAKVEAVPENTDLALAARSRGLRREAQAQREFLPPARAAQGARVLPKAESRKGLVAELGRREAAQRRLQAERAKLVPGLVDSNGKPLTLDQIHAHMRDPNTAGGAINPDEISFLTQAPNRRGARNFWKSFYPRAAERHQPRTGAATEKGTFDAHPATLQEQGARLQGLQDAEQGFQRVIRDFGLHDSGGALIHGDRAAMEAVRNFHAAKTGRDLRIVRLNPWAGKQETLHSLLEGDQALSTFSDHPNVAITETLKDALNAGGPHQGEFGLVDAPVVDQLHAHLDTLRAHGVSKVLRAVNQQFRRTVLATRPTWLTGNVVEAGLRSAIAGAGPRSYFVGRKLLGPKSTAIEQAAARKGIPASDIPALAAEARVRTVAGGHYSMAERQHVRTGAEQFRESGPVLRRTAHALGAFWRAPGPKNVAAAWDRFTHLVFHDINGRLESQFQVALGGKYARKFLMDGQMLKTSRKAIEQAAHGLTNTPEQAAMGRFIDRAYGQYAKFSPGQRQVIALYTPFVAWSLNATRFVFRVLPRDHPVKTALAATLVVHSEEWRKAHGLDLFASGAAPGFLQGSIPVGDAKLRISRYTPFGFFSDPTDSLATLVLPQYSGSLMALRGLDWRGQPLKLNGQPPTAPERFVLALDQFLGGTIPAFAQGAQALGLEGTADRTTSDRISGVLNPFKPVKPKSSSSSGSGKSFDFNSAQPAGGGGGGFDFKSAKPVGP